MSFAYARVNKPSCVAILHAGLGSGSFSSAARPRPSRARGAVVTVSHFHRGHNVNETIATRRSRTANRLVCRLTGTPFEDRVPSGLTSLRALPGLRQADSRWRIARDPRTP